MRLIDADELISEFACRMDDSVESIPTKNVIGFIDSAPEVDAVPVVRCKDCEYFKQNGISFKSDNGIKHNDWCPRIGKVPVKDWFCADGERKTDGTDDD